MVELDKEIEKRKEVVEKEIDKLFDGKDHSLWKSMAWYPQAGGKKLRPFLTMVSAGAFGVDEDLALAPGLSLELIHNFTLIHDDIMDKDEVRRGQETLHLKEGEPTAINAGDGLFALSFKILTESKIDDNKTRRLVDEISDAVIKLAEGQEEDIRFEKTYDISEEEFLKMIEKKTSYLFQAAARCGAVVGGADEEDIERMGEYARKMGIAFQLQDDYLDLVGEEESIGKPVGSDIRAGKRTLMIIKALDRLEKNESDRLIEILDSESNTREEVTEAIGLVREVDALSYCKSLAQRYADGSKEEIKPLLESEYKEILTALVDLVIKRSN